MYTPQILLIEQHRGVKISMDFSQCDSGYTESRNVQLIRPPGPYYLKLKARDNAGNLGNSIMHIIELPDYSQPVIPGIIMPADEIDSSVLQLKGTYIDQVMTISWNSNELCYYKFYLDDVLLIEHIDGGSYSFSLPDTLAPQSPIYAHCYTDSNGITTISWSESYDPPQSQRYKVEEYLLSDDSFNISSDTIRVYYYSGVKDYWYAISDSLIFSDSTDIAGYVFTYSRELDQTVMPLHKGLITDQDFVTTEFKPGETVYIYCTAIDHNTNQCAVKTVQVTMPDDGLIYR